MLGMPPIVRLWTETRETAMRHLIGGVLIAAGLLAPSAQPASAQGGLCDRLWVMRNTIYKQNGYCFATARARQYFGNAGCQFVDMGAVPLSAYDRARIAEIVAEERATGCR
jgi:hypothetical protein